MNTIDIITMLQQALKTNNYNTLRFNITHIIDQYHASLPTYRIARYATTTVINLQGNQARADATVKRMHVESRYYTNND